MEQTLEDRLKLLIALTNNIEIQKRIMHVIKEYVHLQNRTDGIVGTVNKHTPGERAGFDWTIEDDTMMVKWVEYDYRRESSGSFDFPVAWLWDEEARLKGFEKEINNAQKQRDIQNKVKKGKK